MAGIVWFVQIVHYPLFALIPGEALRPYASANVRVTATLAVPVMAAEMAAAALIAHRGSVPTAEAAIGLGLLALAWLSTACVQLPLHRRIIAGDGAAALALLVRTNWIRTLTWTARAVLSLHFFNHAPRV